ncbi:hypothetical protein JXA34_01515 [Patescibacteria group bacterium]|nr:hypothetical protein [Patescibacteria group bacterium]
MKLIPITFDNLFYLYCALIYNNNKTIRLPTPQLEVAENIKRILGNKDFNKITMPDHRYQYLLSILATNKENTMDNIKPTHKEVVSYIKALAEVEKLTELKNAESAQVEEHLSLYGNAFEKVTNLFKESFDFESKYKNIYVTRNFGKSGMFIPVNMDGYLILGNISYKPNIRNLIHELLHAQLEEVNIKITQNIKDIINKLPDEVYDNYKKPYTVVEESLVRSLVVYLTYKNDEFEQEKFSEQDKELVLSESYLEILHQDNRIAFSKDYLENINL